MFWSLSVEPAPPKRAQRDATDDAQRSECLNGTFCVRRSTAPTLARARGWPRRLESCSSFQEDHDSTGIHSRLTWPIPRGEGIGPINQSIHPSIHPHPFYQAIHSCCMELHSELCGMAIKASHPSTPLALLIMVWMPSCYMHKAHTILNKLRSDRWLLTTVLQLEHGVLHDR